MSEHFTGIKLKMLPLQHVTILDRYQLKCVFCSMSPYFTGIKLKMLPLQHLTILHSYQLKMHVL